MRLYKAKNNVVVPHLSLQEWNRIEQSTKSHVPVYRGSEAIGNYSRLAREWFWNKDIQFTEECETVSLFEPEQGA